MDKDLYEFEKQALKVIKEEQEKRKDFWNTVKWVIGIIAVAAIFISAFAYMVHLGKGDDEENRQYRIKYKNHRTKKVMLMYSAWCKETGNPKNLNLDEFRILKLERSSWTGVYYFKEK